MNGPKETDGSFEELRPLSDKMVSDDKVAPANNDGQTEVKRDDDGCCKMASSLRRYPGAVFFMFGNEFCERFSFYGMRAILTLYFIVEHGFTDSKASLFFHLFVAICYFSPLLGSILSDGYFGRFKVILWGSVVYVLGHGLLTMGSIPNISSGLRAFFDFFGLFVIGMATGTIKPCVSAFAADQFPPEMKKEREQFFSYFYFSINAGSFLAIITTPLLRGRVKCLGSEYCFPLAFGVPAVLMAFALFMFIMGWKYYKKEHHKGNIIGRVFNCTAYAIKQRFKGGKDDGVKRDHWLDYALPKYNVPLVKAIKSMCSILIMFIPVVFFWALFDQQGSTWVLQARRMSGRIGRLTILPDHTNVFNPLFIMALIPVFESFIYPAAEKCTKVTALRKMGLGGLLAAVSFIIAGFLQLEVNKSLVPLPNEGDISFFAYNTIESGPCSDMSFVPKVSTDQHNIFYLNSTTRNIFKQSYTPDFTIEAPGSDCELKGKSQIFEHEEQFKHGGFAMATFLHKNPSGPDEHYMRYTNFELEKVPAGRSRIYVLFSYLQDTMRNDNSTDGHVLFVIDENGDEAARLDLGKANDSYTADSHVDVTPAIMSSGVYKLELGINCKGKECTKKQELSKNYLSKTGAADVLVLWQVGDENEPWNNYQQQIIPENKVNILWQIPQFFVITVAEILFSISGLEFSYSQAAPSMRSVLQALWLLTVAFGNCIDIAISGSHVIKEPAAEFFFYACLMGAVMIVFIILASRYKYVDTDKWDDHDLGWEDDKEKKKGQGLTMVVQHSSNDAIPPASSAAHFPGVKESSLAKNHSE